MKRDHRPLGVVFIDLTKAFDTVSHEHIIKNMYFNINTYIFLKNEQSDPIRIWIGVKQGDPISPLLFNLSVDPLLCKLEEEGSGFQHCLKNITSVAFEDDLVLLNGSWEGM